MARYDNGWVKLYRKVLTSDLMSEPEIFTVWCWCLAAASYEESSIKVNSERIKLPPGSVVFSFQKLSKDLSITRGKLRRIFDYLHKTKRISLTCHTKGSFLHIKKWENYQQNQEQDASSTKRDDIKRTSNVHQPDIKRTYIKKVRSKESKKKQIIVFDFLSQELIDWTAGVSDVMRKKWLDRYSQETIILTLQKAKDWSDVKGKKGGNVGLLMNKFFEGVAWDSGDNKTSGLTGKQLEGFSELDKLMEKGK